MTRVSSEQGGDNVFADLGFSDGEADGLAAKSRLIIAIRQVVKRRKLTQREAACLCGTDQPTLSKVFRGRMESVTIDRLAAWLNALGQDVRITVGPAAHAQLPGRLRVDAA